MGLAGIILAAGESTRMGRDKALLPWPPPSPGAPTHTGTLLSAAIQALDPHCELVIVVAGNNEPALRPVVESCGGFLVRNPNPELGQFSSLQTGLRDVLNRGRDAAMITLVDRPPPQFRTLTVLVEEFTARDRGTWAVVPEHAGKHGHPFLVGREMMEQFLRTPSTGNAREVEHANHDRIQYFPVNDARIAMNVDTPAQYAELGRILC